MTSDTRAPGAGAEMDLSANDREKLARAADDFAAWWGDAYSPGDFGAIGDKLRSFLHDAGFDVIRAAARDEQRAAAPVGDDPRFPNGDDFDRLYSLDELMEHCAEAFKSGIEWAPVFAAPQPPSAPQPPAGGMNGLKEAFASAATATLVAYDVLEPERIAKSIIIAMEPHVRALIRKPAEEPKP